LAKKGYPVEGLKLDPDLVIRGLVLDKELGNVLKVDRFGIVRRAMHGTRLMDPAAIRSTYGLETINPRHEERWYFLNTLFSISAANLYLQVNPECLEVHF